MIDLVFWQYALIVAAALIGIGGLNYVLVFIVSNFAPRSKNVSVLNLFVGLPMMAFSYWLFTLVFA